MRDPDGSSTIYDSMLADRSGNDIEEVNVKCLQNSNGADR